MTILNGSENGRIWRFAEQNHFGLFGKLLPFTSSRIRSQIHEPNSKAHKIYIGFTEIMFEIKYF